MAYQIYNVKCADLLFYKDEDSIMRLSIFKDIPLEDNTISQALERGAKLLEWDIDTCEWIIDFNCNMFIYIDDKFYRKISAVDLRIDYSSQNRSKKTDTYMFSLFITDMTDEYSKIVIITDYTVNANCYNAAIAETRKWIEHEYRHFKQLEWYINDRMQIRIV